VEASRDGQTHPPVSREGRGEEDLNQTLSEPTFGAQQSQTDEEWMQLALALAERARNAGEVPVGAVLVRDGELLAEGWNQPISTNDPTAHAEIVALRAAGEKIGNYRMVDTTLYVTLEPCVMCMGAIVHARVKRLVFGAADPKRGAAGSALQLADAGFLNHRVEVEGGVLGEKCADLLREFFRGRR
jgi:tRNA(adenine34) deaminase